MSWSIRAFCIILVAILVKTFIVSIYYVPSVSMLPTIKVGDYILVLKFPYRFRTPETWPLTSIPFPFMSIDGLSEPERGEVVLFDFPAVKSSHPFFKKNLLKRCIAIPGDTVKLFYDYVLVNDQKYELDSNLTGEHLVSSWFIPESGYKQYFMLGDNTIQSIDSRQIGLIPDKNLIGRAVAVIWPWPPRWIE